MKKQEPPHSHKFSEPLLLVGRNSHGQWVVRNRCGSRGGLFVDRANAIKFAMFESGHQPQAIIMVRGILELDIREGQNPEAIAETNAATTRLKPAA